MKKEFRVWDKSRGRFLSSEPSDLIYLYSLVKSTDLGGLSIFSIADDALVVQCSTGAADKYGQKIFEGDIVRAYSDDYENENFVGKVIFDDGNFLTWISKNDIRGVWSGEDIEVIGNIMENPELLTNEQQ
jgi:uncharacterized phage protein (TIGR01671 family)